MPPSLYKLITVLDDDLQSKHPNWKCLMSNKYDHIMYKLVCDIFSRFVNTSEENSTIVNHVHSFLNKHVPDKEHGVIFTELNTVISGQLAFRLTTNIAIQIDDSTIYQIGLFRDHTTRKLSFPNGMFTTALCLLGSHEHDPHRIIEQLYNDFGISAKIKIPAIVVSFSGKQEFVINSPEWEYER